MARKKKKRWLFSLLAVSGIILSCALVVAEETVRLNQDVKGDSQPIILNADDISTWMEGTQRVFLLKGTVLVEHGVIHTRMQGGVAWVDLGPNRKPGILHVEVYAEGEVKLENGPQSQHCQKAVVDLFTRGDLKLNAHSHKVVQQPRSDDPIYLRGVLERSKSTPAAGTPAAAKPQLQRTGYEEPAGNDNNVQKIPSGEPVQAPVPAPGPMSGPGPDPMTPPGNVPTYPYQQPATVTPQPIVTPPIPPGPPPAPPPGLPPATAPGPPAAQAPKPPPQGPERQVRIVPRTSASFQEQTVTLPNGEQAVVVTGGVILTIRNPSQGVSLIDIEADRLVVWTHGNFQQTFANIHGEQGHTTRDLEFYLAGNVEIREQNGPESRKLSAEEIYYDVGRNVAVAYQADLEVKQPGLPDPFHMKAERLEELSPTQFHAVHAEVFASRLPSDPGLKVYVTEGDLVEKRIPKKSIFGMQFVDRNTGLPETAQERLFTGHNIFVEVEDVPIFYFPYIRGDAENPLGPLKSIMVNQNRVFGTQLYTTFNAYDLLGIDPLPGTNWDLDADYLSHRGPALGTNFDYGGNHLFGIPGKYNGLFKAYGIDDQGKDILGGGRGETEHHPELRGRFLWRQRWELPEDFTFQAQLSLLSDHNFLEQYFKDEFDRDVNQDTYLYLKQQRSNWAWTAMVEDRVEREWVTETNWLPRVDGYLIGQTLDLPFLDRLTYDTHASAGYAELKPTKIPPPPVEITDVGTDTGRFDWWNELSLPFYLGPVKTVPYAVGDFTYYTNDLTGTDDGRLYGGAGLRASLPFQHLYPDVQSDFLNINGINHKIVMSANYFVANASAHFSRFPQLDRLNDDASDQSLRDIRPMEVSMNPTHGLALATSPLFDPQTYAIRQLIDNRVDTLDTIEEVQLDLRQRLQTKRGYPGNQHVVDWMTLDLSGTYFPDSKRDNFGSDFAFLQYDYTWNLGDRTAFTSSGWMDPIDQGAHVFSAGFFFDRPDRTTFYIGYMQIEPLESKLISGSVSYVFSPKYAMTMTTGYDFGIVPNVSESLVFTRMGSDLQLSLGVTYNTYQNNFGFVVELVPNLLAASNRRVGMIPGLGAGGLGSLPH